MDGRVNDGLMEWFVGWMDAVVGWVYLLWLLCYFCYWWVSMVWWYFLWYDGRIRIHCFFLLFWFQRFHVCHSLQNLYHLLSIGSLPIPFILLILLVATTTQVRKTQSIFFRSKTSVIYPWFLQCGIVDIPNKKSSIRRRSGAHLCRHI